MTSGRTAFPARADMLAVPTAKGRDMSQQPQGHHPALDILRKIVDATDRLQKARESGNQQEVQTAQQARREAMHEARQFVQTHQG